MNVQVNEFFHGCNNPAVVLDAIVGGGKLRNGFHLAVDPAVARNYGAHLIKVMIEGDLVKAHVGMINKDGNFNKKVGNGIEVVLKDEGAVNELYEKLWDAELMV
jgi:hypothetical protein